MRIRPLFAFAIAPIVVTLGAGCDGDGEQGAASASATDVATSDAAGQSLDTSPSPSSAAPSTIAGSTPATAGGEDPVCSELERIQALSIEMQQVLAPAMPVLRGSDADAGLDQLAAVADAMETMLPEIVDAYADAAAVADDTMALDIEAVSKATETVMPLMVDVFRSAQSPADLAGLEQALSSPEVQSSSISGAEAALRIDEFTEPECGFKFSAS